MQSLRPNGSSESNVSPIRTTPRRTPAGKAGCQRRPVLTRQLRDSEISPDSSRRTCGKTSRKISASSTRS
ncbi:hypothetical protein I552_0715 [Mycobacterium xenopi 3993]|nr:hypothetical protein I552_0715 [Mycobacterium xenopi 3993]